MNSQTYLYFIKITAKSFCQKQIPPIQTANGALLLFQIYVFALCLLAAAAVA